jgi:hypothetical protein
MLVQTSAIIGLRAAWENESYATVENLLAHLWEH